MKRLFLFLTLISWDALSQGFSQINQTPLLYHSSFAGATGGGRLAGVSNVITYKARPDIYRSYSSYLSYDNLWKGIGYGISFLNTTAKGTDPFTMHYGSTRTLSKSSYAGNLHVSTKHVFFNSHTGRAKYTISPSLSFGYIQSRSQVDFSESTHPPTITTNKTAHVTLGVLMNTQYGYIGVSYKNEYRTSIYNYASWGILHMPYFSYQESRTSSLIPSFSFVFAQTLSSREKNAILSLTPSGYVSFVSYYKKREGYSTNLISMSDYCLNLTATIWKIYIGAGTTNTHDAPFNLFTGFKHDRFRTGIGYGWSASLYRDPSSFYEFSFSYFFKPRAERTSEK